MILSIRVLCIEPELELEVDSLELEAEVDAVVLVSVL